MKGSNIHTKEIFERAYKDKDWGSYRSLVADCIRYGKPGRWLDLGAGLGLFVECAKRFGIDCIGLEGSEWAVKEAKKRFPNIDIRQHFLEDKIPFKNNSFSTIICHQIIEHLDKKTTIFMLKECYRVLRRGGIILIYSPSAHNQQQKLEETHINLYTPKSLRKEVKQVGFKIIAEPNNLKLFLGDNIFSRVFSRLLYLLSGFQFLSNTANIIAMKT